MKTYEKVYGVKRICVSHLGAIQILNEYPLLSGTRCGRVATLLPSAAIRRTDSGRNSFWSLAFCGSINGGLQNGWFKWKHLPKMDDAG